MRHLRVLDTVSRSGSLTRAAVALGVSQPALTAQLLRIERLLGAAVFARGRKGVTATPFGEFVLAQTRAVLADVDDIVAARPDGPGMSTLRIGGFESPTLLEVAGRLEAALPGVRCTLRAEYSTRLLLDMIASGRLDLALITDYPGHELRPLPSVQHDLVAFEPVFVALSAGHRLAGRTEVGLAELAGEVWVLPPSDGTGWPEHFAEACAAAGFAPRAGYRMVDAAMKRDLVAAGWAVWPCQATVDPGEDVAVRPLEDDPVRMRHLVAWRPAGPLAAHAAMVVELARDAYATVVRDRPAYNAWLRRRGRTVGAAWQS